MSVNDPWKMTVEYASIVILRSFQELRTIEHTHNTEQISVIDCRQQYNRFCEEKMDWSREGGLEMRSKTCLLI
jgi:hypothetical protein